MKKIVFALCCCLFATFSFSQIEDASYKFQAGLNAAPLWLSKTQANPALILKYNVWRDVQIRAQFGLNGGSNAGDRSVLVTNAFFSNGTVDSTITNNPANYNNLFASIGFGNTKDLNAEFKFQYGVDYIWSQMSDERTELIEVNQEFQPGNKTFIVNKNVYSTTEKMQGLSFFGGMLYTPHPRVSFGIETSFQFLYGDVSSKRKTNMKQWNQFNPQIFEQKNESSGKQRNISYGFKPVSALYLTINI